MQPLGTEAELFLVSKCQIVVPVRNPPTPVDRIMLQEDGQSVSAIALQQTAPQSPQTTPIGIDFLYFSSMPDNTTISCVQANVIRLLMRFVDGN